VDLGSGRVCLRTLNHMFGLGLGLELGLVTFTLTYFPQVSGH